MTCATILQLHTDLNEDESSTACESVHQQLLPDCGPILAGKAASALSELLDNATRHGTGTSARIHAQTDASATNLRLVVEDDSHPWNPDDAPTHQPGQPHGHGVAILRGICRYTWQAMSNPPGNRHVLEFPLS